MPLYTWTAPRIGLSDALAWSRLIADSSRPTIALVQTPDQCAFARVEAAGLNFPENGRVAEDAIFDLRAFSPDGEVRWRRDPADREFGRAALLTDQNLSEPPAASEPQSTAIVALVPQRYLLWGQGDQPGRPGGLAPVPGWSWLTGGRHPPLAVPIAGVQPQHYVRLLAQEYLARQEETGNTYVFDERLLGLEAFAVKANRGSTDD